jgi:hypothetical protein
VKSDSVKEEFLYLRANAGHSLPILYEGAVLRIVPGAVAKLQVSKLAYDTKIQIEKALNQKAILKEGVK